MASIGTTVSFPAATTPVRMPYFASSLVGVTMLVGTAASLWQRNTAINERNQKEQALNEANAAKLEFEPFAAVVQQSSYFQTWVARAQFLTEVK